jgi:hypothetical protein
MDEISIMVITPAHKALGFLRGLCGSAREFSFNSIDGAILARGAAEHAEKSKASRTQAEKISPKSLTFAGLWHINWFLVIWTIVAPVWSRVWLC